MQSHIIRTTIAGLALAALIAPTSFSAAASAQTYPDQQATVEVPVYTTWQTDWDSNKFDRQHVMLGIVSDFSPYRLTVQRADGFTQTIDLQNGTQILPTGTTPARGQHAALIGYYSKGTFIANRVILRP